MPRCVFSSVGYSSSRRRANGSRENHATAPGACGLPPLFPSSWHLQGWIESTILQRETMPDVDWTNLRSWATEEVESVLQHMPKELASSAKQLPVTLEPVPNPGLLEDGIEPDTLGLFTGEDMDAAIGGQYPLPPQILLFLENIWDYAEEQEDIFREEVRLTYLHELGHYLGLDEDDLWDRGVG